MKSISLIVFLIPIVLIAVADAQFGNGGFNGFGRPPFRGPFGGGQGRGPPGGGGGSRPGGGGGRPGMQGSGQNGGGQQGNQNPPGQQGGQSPGGQQGGQNPGGQQGGQSPGGQQGNGQQSGQQGGQQSGSGGQAPISCNCQIQLNTRTIRQDSTDTAFWNTNVVNNADSACQLNLRCNTNNPFARIVFFSASGQRIGTDDNAKTSATKQLLCQPNGVYIRPNGGDVVAQATCCSFQC